MSKFTMRRAALATSLILMPSLAWAGDATEYSPSPDSRDVIVKAAGAETRFPMPCQPAKVLRVGPDRLAGTCTDKEGLLVIDISNTKEPRALEIRGYEGKLKDVYVVGDDVWIDLEGEGSRPLSFASSEPEAVPAPVVVTAPASTAETVTPAEPTVPVEPVEDTLSTSNQIGRVLTVKGRNVVVDLGRNDGMKKDETVEFFATDDIVYEGETIRKEETVAMGRIKTVELDRSVVEISLNVDLPETTNVRRSNQEFKPNYIAPPHPPAHSELAFTLRPFLALDTIGGGAIIDASYTYRFDFPMALDFVLSPAGFAVTDEGNALGFAGHAIVSYDARVFQIGLGAGAARYEEEVPYEVLAGGDAPDTMVLGFSAAQHVRLGTRDGLNFTATTNFVVQRDGFEFGGMTGIFQIPMSSFLSDTWLIFRGGGGLPGHAFGEIGIRALVAGNGSSGSVFLTPTLGGASMSNPEYKECGYQEGYLCKVSNDYGGPMAGLTVEWRP